MNSFSLPVGNCEPFWHAAGSCEPLRRRRWRRGGKSCALLGGGTQHWEQDQKDTFAKEGRVWDAERLVGDTLQIS